MSSGTDTELEELYAEQKQLLNETRRLREQEQDFSKKTTRKRVKRDEIKQKRQILLSQARKKKDFRDEINRQIGESKQTRDKAVNRSRQLRQKTALAASAKHDTSEYDLLSVVELQYGLYELEYELQTRSHSSSRKRDQNNERELVDRISELEELIEKRTAAGELDGLETPPPSEEVSGMIDDLKAQAQTSHEEMILLVERGQKEHSEVSRMFDEVSRLQEEENNLHQEFVDSLNGLERTRTTIESHQKRLDDLKDEITDLKIKKAEFKEKARIEASQKQIDSLLAKKREGKGLSPEEMEFLMAHGESPF
ncbi:MAG: DUF7121 family protein [Candidatus Hodarchaeales archaeon]|jgi:uncharacterized coiled-coil DUF342 family protein